MYALYSGDEDTDRFESKLLGYIERRKDGSWDCFGPREKSVSQLNPIGREPNRKYAMEKVVEAF